VEVRELFFSTPARRKFLKTDATELAHCLDAVRRHALARPDVGFAVWHEGKLVAQWRAGPTRRSAWPTCWAPTSWPASRRWPGAGRCAWPAASACPRPRAARADQQYLYVNGRFVRDRLIGARRALAYEDQLHGSRQPAYALFITSRRSWWT
jgi:DNA mismatch repair protein MutL